eukprot:1543144-Rhodomonas_salina.1
MLPQPQRYKPLYCKHRLVQQPAPFRQIATNYGTAHTVSCKKEKELVPESQEIEAERWGGGG